MKTLFFIKQIGFLIIFFSLGYSQPNWIWQNPIPQGENINKIQFTHSYTGYSVGNYFSILKTTNGGENWITKSINPDSIPTGLNGNFSSLFFLNSNTGYIGRNGIFKTTNGGESWTFQNTTFSISSIFFTTADTGYASCDAGRIIKTTNGGINWELQFSIGDISNYFHKITFISKNTGFVTGNFGTILKTTNQGVNWVMKNQPSGLKILDIFFVNNIFGVASCSEGKLLKTNNGGENWSFMNSSELGYVNLNSVKFLNSDTGYLVSNNNGQSDGLVYKTTNAGNNWTLLFNFGYFISEIIFNNFNDVYLSCDGGNILKSTDSGIIWENKIKNVGISQLQSINFLNDKIGYIAGSKNTILKTTNGGTEWELQLSPAYQNYKYIKFYDNENGYLAGLNLYKTSNGGFNWDSIAKLDSLVKIDFLNLDTGYYLNNNTMYKTFNRGDNWTGQFTINKAVDFCFLKNNDTGFVLNNYFTGSPQFQSYVTDLYRTTNNGLNWILINSFDTGPYSGFLNSIVFLNSNIGFISGAPGIYKTINGGINWRFIENSYGYSSPVSFYNENVGFVTNYNKVFKTTNSGNNWSEVFESSKNFNFYYFTGLNTGYVIGDYGYILKTTNGGGIFVNINENSENLSTDFILLQNYPNPFNPSTKIEFELPKENIVKLTIYDILGKSLKILVNEKLSSGKHTFTFHGNNFSTGIYFYKLETETMSQTKKMLLIK